MDSPAELYAKCYADRSYKMGKKRKAVVIAAVEAAIDANTQSMLDVGCGRGEVLDHFRGRLDGEGAEVVPDLCHPDPPYHVWDIPRGVVDLGHQFHDRSFNIVVCSDVLEHIEPEETEKALEELWRVTGQTLILHVAWFSHVYKGTELHINKRDLQEWGGLVLAATGCDEATFKMSEPGSKRALLVARR